MKGRTIPRREPAVAAFLACALALACGAPPASAAGAGPGPRASVMLHAPAPAAPETRLPTLVELVRASEWILGALFVDQGSVPVARDGGSVSEHHYLGQVLSIQHSPPDSAVRAVSWFVDDPPAGAAPAATSARDSVRWNEGDRKILFLLPDLRDARRVATACGRHGIFDYADTTVTGVVAADTATRRAAPLRLGIVAFTDTIIRIDRALRAEADSLQRAAAAKATLESAKKPAPAPAKRPAKRRGKGN